MLGLDLLGMELLSIELLGLELLGLELLGLELPLQYNALLLMLSSEASGIRATAIFGQKTKLDPRYEIIKILPLKMLGSLVLTFLYRLWFKVRIKNKFVRADD